MLVLARVGIKMRYSRSKGEHKKNNNNNKIPNAKIFKKEALELVVLKDWNADKN